jgi:hypothetical protein
VIRPIFVQKTSQNVHRTHQHSSPRHHHHKSSLLSRTNAEKSLQCTEVKLRFSLQLHQYVSSFSSLLSKYLCISRTEVNSISKSTCKISAVKFSTTTSSGCSIENEACYNQLRDTTSVKGVVAMGRKLLRIPRVGEVVLLGTAAISVISVIWIESTIGF